MRTIRSLAAGTAALAIASGTALLPALIPAAPASAATACVYLDFGESNTYQPCVRDEQVLLNDLWKAGRAGPNQLLTVDGYYGSHTVSDVKAFQTAYALTVDGITGPQTWDWLCLVDAEWGFTGTYYQAVGCPLIN